MAPSEPRSASPQKASASTKWLILLVGIAVVLAVVFVFVLLGRKPIDATVLDVREAEAGVSRILSDPINGYGANDVTAVKCNGGKNPVVQQGNTFTCAVTINGNNREVQVVFRDDAGTYEVDGPR